MILPINKFIFNQINQTNFFRNCFLIDQNHPKISF